MSHAESCGARMGRGVGAPNLHVEVTHRMKMPWMCRMLLCKGIDLRSPNLFYRITWRHVQSSSSSSSSSRIIISISIIIIIIIVIVIIITYHHISAPKRTHQRNEKGSCRFVPGNPSQSPCRFACTMFVQTIKARQNLQ